MDMTRATIFKENIDNDLWLKLIHIITYMKNNWLLRILQNFSLYKIYTYNFSNSSHF